jgi:cytosine/adenosine deaminase-related metal-dependent hydrolase
MSVAVPRSAPSCALALLLAAAVAACGGGGGGGGGTTGTGTGADADQDGIADAADDCPTTANPDQADRDGDGKGDACDPCPDVANRGATACPEVVECGALPPAQAGACDATAGTGGLLLRGDVLLPGRILHGGSVAVNAGGLVTCVGCDCAAAAPAATVITCPRSAISAGLVDAHAHVAYQSPPVADGGERYEHRHQWRRGTDGHTALTIPSAGSADDVAWGELRGILAGTTSVVGAGGVAGLQRNLDRAALLEGLAHAAAAAVPFPLGDTAGTTLTSGCGYPAISTPAAFTGASAALLHAAEGIDAAARNELLCLSSTANGGQDLLGVHTALVGAVALTPADWALAASRYSRLVWSPRSNVRLYGDTARVTVADRLGVRIALGTDWLPTGSMNLLRELRCADDWNRARLGRHFGDEALWLMATRNAADAAGMADVLGAIAVGKVGDLAVFDAQVHRDYRAVVAADPRDVTLVVRGGKVLYGDAHAVEVARGAGACDTLDVCGAPRRVCLAGELGKGLPALAAAEGAAYPLFSCGEPAGEPTCVPARSTSVSGSSTYTGAVTGSDLDGDGLAGPADRCPSTFDPRWPLHGGVEADADGDGVADACDPCPLASGTTACTAPDPDDVDGDGVPNDVDVCPYVSDPGQADADQDGKGDACDACPTANPGQLACPASVYEVKNGTYPAGSRVSLASALVTGAAPGGFFVQVHEADAGYQGRDFSGVWVSALTTVAPGDRVRIEAGQVTVFYGQTQLVPETPPVVLSSGHALPVPEPVAPADVATGAARAAALEGVLVRVQGVSVVDVAPPLGPGDTAPSNEFVVTAGLRVDDLLWLATPFPSVGQGYASITGVLAHVHGDSTLEPRSAGDLVATLGIAAFGPPGFLREGAANAPTIPAPLDVTLTAPAPADTFVQIVTTSTAVSVRGGGVTVAAGQTTAHVLLDGLARDPVAMLTASLGATSAMSTVRVLGATEVPGAVTLTGPAASIAPGGTASLTVTLDLPAPPGGTVVTLALTPAGAGTVPAIVTVPADQLQARFDYVDGGVASSAEIAATIGSSTSTATITVAVGQGGLVVNEIDYDNVGTDTLEFVELYNAGAVAVDLTNVALVFVNGLGGVEYGRVSLASAGALPAGGFLVAGSAALVATVSGAATIALDAAFTIQNGSPDGVLLLDTATGQVIDALSYEGSITAATLTGVAGTVSLVEGTAVPLAVADSNTAQGSLCRLPNGTDTDDASADWAFCSAPTPGTANAP